MNILIADDDRNFTQLLSTFFEAKGHRVGIAYDAFQALAAVMRTPPDVILLDVLMPGGSGLHALQRLKASTRTNRIPLVILPGCNGTAAMKKAEELRAVVREQVIKTVEGAILVTLSLGVAASTEVKETTSNSLVHAAEEALDRASKAGGDRIELASELTTYEKPPDSTPPLFH